jgi:hypothetical protein
LLGEAMALDGVLLNEDAQNAMFGPSLKLNVDDVKAVRSGYPPRDGANLIDIESHCGVGCRR